MIEWAEIGISKCNPGGRAMGAANTLASDLQIEIKDQVAHLTLNRPEKRNALSRQLMAELDAALAGIAGDRAVRAVVLAGQGLVFCAGHDLGEMTGCSKTSYRELFELCARVML